jgi:hypothetical protein
MARQGREGPAVCVQALSAESATAALRAVILPAESPAWAVARAAVVVAAGVVSAGVVAVVHGAAADTGSDRDSCSQRSYRFSLQVWDKQDGENNDLA